MKRLLSSGFLVMVLSAFMAVSAQTVDQDELSGILDKVINFQNYSGSYQKIDSLADILAIGSGLARGIDRAADSSGTFGAAYRVLHILGTPQEKGKPADVLLLLEPSKVDHIDNVRRIIASYLKAAYKFNDKDAQLVAFYLTVYNAVYRGNLEYFQGRYKASVLKVLQADKVGLALSYKEWPGKTQIVIPLGLGVATVTDANKLSSVNTAELTGPTVLEMVKDNPTKNTDKRQAMADLMDRSIDQEQAAIDAEKARLAKEKADLLKKQADDAAAKAKASPAPSAGPAASQTPKTQASPTPAPGNTVAKASASPAASPSATAPVPGPGASNPPPASPAPAATEAPKTEDQKKLDEIAKKEADLKAREDQNKELDAAARKLREDTAKDLKKDDAAQAASENLLFLKSVLDQGLIVSTLQRINTSSGEILGEGKELAILNRQVQNFAGGLLVLARDKDAAALVLIDETSLASTKKGSAVISPWSQVVILPGGKECLAVLKQEGAWYLGRFDSSLNPVARSVIAVDPLGVITLREKSIIVQRQDGRASILNIDDLGTAR